MGKRNKISAAQRREFAADVTAEDVRIATAAFKKSFGEWIDPEEWIGEAMAHWWPCYCARRYRGDDHLTAAKRATRKAIGEVCRLTRFDRAGTQLTYVDERHPMDRKRRDEIDENRKLDSLLATVPDRLDAWQRMRIELFAALGMVEAPESRQRPPCRLPVRKPAADDRPKAPPRKRCQRPTIYRPYSGAPLPVRKPAGPRFATGTAWNHQRLDERRKPESAAPSQLVQLSGIVRRAAEVMLPQSVARFRMILRTATQPIDRQ